MHGAKGGGREGYRERVREIEGNRERDGEWEKEKYIQFGTLNDLWGHTWSYEKFASSQC